MWVTSSVQDILQPTAIALGNFDGIHRGHQKVLQPILKLSDQVNKTVVSFKPHPREFFTGQAHNLLTPVGEKAQFLKSLGFDQLVLLEFNQELANLAPQEFVKQIIVQQLKAIHISVGQDFHFGYQRRGNAEDLKRLAEDFQIKVDLVSLQKIEYCHHSSNPKTIQKNTPHPYFTRISSSLIREALKSGKLEKANLMLGRPYSLQGEVIRGRQLGRKIGFPTANLKVPDNKFLPRFGVYAVRVSLNDKLANSLLGVMNIGYRPTVSGNYPSVEVHLFDWENKESLYNHSLHVRLEKFLRPEQKFASLEELKQQIKQDCLVAKSFFSQT